MESNINVTPEFVLAGEATFTVSNQQGLHYTYKVDVSKPTVKYPQVAYFIKVLKGGDDDYAYMGKLIPPTGKRNRPDIQLTARSRFEATSPAVKVANWALGVIWQQAAGMYKLKTGYTIQHDGRCGRCGHKLTDPASIDSGIGPDCASILGVERIERDDRQRALQFKEGDPNSRRTKQNTGPDRRKGPRTMHIIDEHTSYRDRVLAHNDLVNFFDPSKHHGGF